MERGGPPGDLVGSEAERVRDFAEADRLRAGGREDRRRATALYLRHQASLDPRRPEDAQRFELVVQGTEVTLEPLLRRIVADVPGTELGGKALVTLGAVCDRSGRSDEAERIYQDALKRWRGSGSRIEVAALVNLARLFRMSERQPEALLAARQAENRARALGDTWGVGLTRSYVCGALVSMEDWLRLDEGLMAFAAAIEEAPPGRRANLRSTYHGYRSTLRVVSGNAEGALGDADAMGRAFEECGADAAQRRWVWLRRAIALFALERTAEGHAALARARDAVTFPDSFLVEVEVLSVERAAREGRVAEALGASERLLGVMRSAGAAALGTGARLRQAAALGRLLGRLPGGEAAARSAFDEAGAAALERIVEVESALRGYPELEAPAVEDLRTLEDHRRRMRAEQEAVLDAVARLILPAVAGGEQAFRSILVPGELVAVCAWCRRVRAADGRWLPIHAYVPDRGPLRFTHGICEDCRRRMFPQF